MLIAGYRKSSFLDYPGKPCAVVFTPYCNMNCTYCHNYQILRGSVETVPTEEVMEFLEKRAGFLPAVTVSGGEPTLQQDLIPFMERLKELGYLVKLDTNGMRPDVLKNVMLRGLVDYVAMDIKASPEKYDAVTRVKCNMDAIRDSIRLLKTGTVPYEFRTTFAPELTKEDILGAAELIRGTEKYFLQQYRARCDEDLPAHVPSYVQETADAVRTLIGVCDIRGL